MDFFYAFNDAYASLAGISIFSLIKNNKKCSSISFHIIDSGISSSNRDKITKMIINNGYNVTFYEMPSFKSLIGNEMDTGRWNINVYSKLFIGRILPASVHKVICIDCDTIILRPLNELWDTDLSSAIVAGVNEPMSKYYRHYLGKKDNESYLNSGLLLFNVDAMRREKYDVKFTRYLKKYGSSLAYLDQDAINAVIPNNKMVVVLPKYNVITPIFCCSYKELIKTRRVSVYYSKNEYIEAKRDPCIVHFTTFFMNDLRPWFEGSQHPKSKEFLTYKNQSPWKDEPLWKDERKGIKKYKGRLVLLLPRIVKRELSSILHGVVVPKKNKIKMRKALRCSLRGR